MTDNPSRSDQQIRASKANGAKSRGPTSSEGKAKSAKNSKKHGLTGRLDLSAEDEKDEVKKLISKLGARYNVDDVQQAKLIDRVILATLRLNRARALITEILTNIADPKKTHLSEEQHRNNTAIIAIRNQLQELTGGKPPSLVLAKAIAEADGYTSIVSRPNRAALDRLIRYAQRFRGERDRALTRLEAIRKLVSAASM